MTEISDPPGLRVNSSIIPNDYYLQLFKRGGRRRKKAMAFLSYAMNMQLGIYRSQRFYSDMWGVSPATAHAWVHEFDDELDAFEYDTRQWKRRRAV